MSDRSDLLKSTNAMLALPNSASMVLGDGSVRKAKSKNLFYIEFARPHTVGSERPMQWSDVGFICKSVSKPTVQPQTEEISQYGKKRIIHTGIKYDPVNLTLYDTSDSLAQQLWAEYAAYHFGAFNQATNLGWFDDITSNTMQGADVGFGYKPRPDSGKASGNLDTQFFFESMKIYDVWGGMYTQTTLINPKITSYQPDTSDYEDSGVATISMTLEYEAVLYANLGKPMLVSSSPVLTGVFGFSFGGDALEVSGESYASTRNAIADAGERSTQSQINGLLGTLTGGLGDITSIATGGFGALNEAVRLTNAVTGVVSGKGVLSKFGNFNFGTTGIGKAVARAGSIVNTTQSAINVGGKALTKLGGGAVKTAIKETGGKTQIASTSGLKYSASDNAEFAKISLTPEFYDATNNATDGTVQFGKNGDWT